MQGKGVGHDERGTRGKAEELGDGEWGKEMEDEQEGEERGKTGRRGSGR